MPEEHTQYVHLKEICDANFGKIQVSNNVMYWLMSLRSPQKEDTKMEKKLYGQWSEPHILSPEIHFL